MCILYMYKCMYNIIHTNNKHNSYPPATGADPLTELHANPPTRNAVANCCRRRRRRCCCCCWSQMRLILIVTLSGCLLQDSHAHC